MRSVTMDTALGDSLQTVGVWVITIIVLLGLVSRIVWSIGKFQGRAIYFPDRKTCYTVHNRLPDWWRKAKALISHRANVNVLGFLTTPCWVLLIGLNVFLLAQVLELFILGGKRIPFPLVGTYGVMPLIMGILYATSESIFAIMMDEANSKWLKYSLAGVFVTMIVVEGLLAYYRTSVITTGEQLMSPSAWDAILFRVGPILGGLIALFVGTAEALTGKYSFRNFVEGILSASLHWVAGVVASIWCGIAYWICGWHPISPPSSSPATEEGTWKVRPKWLEELSKEAKDIEQQKTRLNNAVVDLVHRSNNLRLRPKSVSELSEELGRLRSSVGEQPQSHWDKTVTEFKEVLDRINDFRGLRVTKVKVKSLSFTIRRTEDEVQRNTRSLADQVVQGPKNYSKWWEYVAHFNNELEGVKDSRDRLLAKLSELDERAAAYGSSNPSAGPDLLRIRGSLGKIRSEIGLISNSIGGLSMLDAGATTQPDDYEKLANSVTTFLKNDIPSLKASGSMAVKLVRRDYKARRRKVFLHEMGSLMPWHWGKNHSSARPLPSNHSGPTQTAVRTDKEVK
jgi:hypothetical protein